MTEKITFETEYIKLDSFLKLCGAATTGGAAKLLISQGLVSVCGTVCTMRGKKLHGGETVSIGTTEYEAIRLDG